MLGKTHVSARNLTQDPAHGVHCVTPRRQSLESAVGALNVAKSANADACHRGVEEAASARICRVAASIAAARAP